MNLQLIFLGAPGSGKGTQALKLVANKSYNHISTGDLLRSEVAKGTELGKRVHEVMTSGQLVQDDLVLELLKANCDLNKGSFIFDGFPRNLEQAKALDKHVLGEATSKAMYFEMDTNILVQRLTQRRMCRNCSAIFNLKSKIPKKEGICDDCDGELYQRKDDKEDVIKNRLDVFLSANSPVIEYYEGQGRLVKINAAQDSELVYKEVLQALN